MEDDALAEGRERPGVGGRAARGDLVELARPEMSGERRSLELRRGLLQRAHFAQRGGIGPRLSPSIKRKKRGGRKISGHRAYCAHCAFVRRLSTSLQGMRNAARRPGTDVCGSQAATCDQVLHLALNCSRAPRAACRTEQWAWWSDSNTDRGASGGLGREGAPGGGEPRSNSARAVFTEARPGSLPSRSRQNKGGASSAPSESI